MDCGVESGFLRAERQSSATRPTRPHSSAIRSRFTARGRPRDSKWARARAMRDGCFMRARSRRGKGGRTTRTTAGLRNGLWHFSLSLREGATATEGEGVCKILLLVCPCWRRLGFFTTRGRTDADGREDNCHIAPFPDWPGGWVLVW